MRLLAAIEQSGANLHPVQPKQQRQRPRDVSVEPEQVSRRKDPAGKREAFGETAEAGVETGFGSATTEGISCPA